MTSRHEAGVHRLARLWLRRSVDSSPNDSGLGVVRRFWRQPYQPDTSPDDGAGRKRFDLGVVAVSRYPVLEQRDPTARYHRAGFVAQGQLLRRGDSERSPCGYRRQVRGAWQVRAKVLVYVVVRQGGNLSPADKVKVSERYARLHETYRWWRATPRQQHGLESRRIGRQSQVQLAEQLLATPEREHSAIEVAHHPELEMALGGAEAIGELAIA